MPAARFGSPRQVDEAEGLDWLPLAKPMTVAAALREAGAWSLDGPLRRLDAEDWWYRLDFDAPAVPAAESLCLGFEGLAGVADLWLDGEPLLRSDNMFVAHACALRPGRHTLHLCFHALDTLLAQRRPRPRWRTPMVEHQQLRWFRSSLLGRTPGWSPPAPAIGPWRDVWIERRSRASLQPPWLRTTLDGAGRGRVDVACMPWADDAGAIARIELEVERGGAIHRAEFSRPAGPGAAFEASLVIPGAERWWPHTHGDPALYAARLIVHPADGGAPQPLPLPSIGFRELVLDQSSGAFALRFNGVPVFCRGACWMPLDVASLRASPEAYRAAIDQARAAGMNMLRISGATVYEDRAFFDACDEAGMLVWQDLMFANMDYPSQDEGFMASVHQEVGQQLSIWQGRPSLAVVCGNSEVEQQAAMWGAPSEAWTPELFHGVLRRLVEERLPEVPYWPSSAHGGAFPHQSDVGTSSYFGVGAYLRPVEDARRADVAFATECLAFANVPEPATIDRMPGGSSLRVHHPAWKARAPRDLGAGWDFEDVRDHYLREGFAVDPLRCRYADHERYLACSRVVTGELMARAFAEWRRPASRCGGALVWFLRDLWPGAGWGLVDDMGLPKAAYYHLRRALQPLAVVITDEGGNGLVAHVINEGAQGFDGHLQVRLVDAAGAVGSTAERACRVPARASESFALNRCFDGFIDLSHAYRFGPPPARVVQVGLHGAGGSEPIEAFHFTDNLAMADAADIGLSAVLQGVSEAEAEVVVQCARFAQSVHLQLEGFVFNDNHFHLLPGRPRRVRARRHRVDTGSPPRGSVTALNAGRVITLRASA